MNQQDGFISVWDCKHIMSKDEWKRFRMWILDKPGRRTATGQMEWPYETIAAFFNAIEKEPPEKQL